jgi:thioredoxin-like negative regulator of GroEL
MAPARYLLAAAYVQQGEVSKARDVLLTITAEDADYAKAQRLLKAIEAQSGAPR